MLCVFTYCCCLCSEQWDRISGTILQVSKITFSSPCLSFQQCVTYLKERRSQASPYMYMVPGKRILSSKVCRTFLFRVICGVLYLLFCHSYLNKMSFPLPSSFSCFTPSCNSTFFCLFFTQTLTYSSLPIYLNEFSRILPITACNFSLRFMRQAPSTYLYGFMILCVCVCGGEFTPSLTFFSLIPQSLMPFNTNRWHWCGWCLSICCNHHPISTPECELLRQHGLYLHLRHHWSPQGCRHQTFKVRTVNFASSKVMKPWTLGFYLM